MKEQLLAMLAGWLDSVSREGSQDQSITFEKVGTHKDENGEPLGPIILVRAQVNVGVGKLNYEEPPRLIMPSHTQQ